MTHSMHLEGLKRRRLIQTLLQTGSLHLPACSVGAHPQQVLRIHRQVRLGLDLMQTTYLQTYLKRYAPAPLAFHTLFLSYLG